MFILYFALWVILNGRWTTEIGVFGAVFAMAAYLFTCKFMGYSLSLDFALLKRAPHAIRYGAVLLGEIVKSNLTVMRMVLDRTFEPHPHLVKFDVTLKKERHRVALANSITLTPGTITVSLDENHYLVHCLDTSMIDGLDNGEMVGMLETMERLHMAADQKKADKTAAQHVEEAAPAAENPEETTAAENEENTTPEMKEDEHEH